MVKKHVSNQSNGNLMKHLFVVRHGDYWLDNSSITGRSLTEQGAQRIESLSGFIRTNGKPDFYIVSSPEPVAMQTAKIIAENLKAKILKLVMWKNL